jgi:TonB family protein
MKSIVTFVCFLLTAGIAAGITELPRAVPGSRVELGKVDAVVIKRVLPVYPAAMLLARIEGNVQLEILVNAEGKVTKVIALSATERAFADEARRAVAKWEFAKPAQLGEDGRAHYLLPVDFRLRRD